MSYTQQSIQPPQYLNNQMYTTSSSANPISIYQQPNNMMTYTSAAPVQSYQSETIYQSQPTNQQFVNQQSQQQQEQQQQQNAYQQQSTPQVSYSEQRPNLQPQPQQQQMTYQQQSTPQFTYFEQRPATYQQQPQQFVYEQRPVVYQQQPQVVYTQVVQQVPQQVNEEAKKRLIADIVARGKFIDYFLVHLSEMLVAFFANKY